MPPAKMNGLSRRLPEPATIVPTILAIKNPPGGRGQVDFLAAMKLPEPLRGSAHRGGILADEFYRLGVSQIFEHEAHSAPNSVRVNPIIGWGWD